MRGGRAWVMAVVGLFVGFWVLRGLFGGPDPSSFEPQTQEPQALQSVEESERTIVQLVEPRGLGGVFSPTRLLRNMYPTLWNAEGFCWEETTSDFDAETRRVATGLTDDSDPPADLLAMFELRSDDYDDYEHKSFNSRRLLFLHQEVIVTEAGREGPLATVFRIVRMESADGQQSWQDDESASVYPCDAVR